MAYELHRPGLTQALMCATDVLGRVPVALSGTTALTVSPCASANAEPHGMTIASALVNTPVSVFERSNVVKAVAGASVGVGARVSVGSSNGALIPAVATTSHWTVGFTQTAAAAGEVFSLYVDPRKAA